MPRVGIVTHSSSCLTEELAVKYGIMVVPAHLIIGKKDYRENKDITTAEFWSEFRELDGRVTIATASPEDYFEVFKKLSESTDSIICFVESAKLSSSFESSVQAKELITRDFPDLKIYVIDSRTTAGGLGFIAREAAVAARSGKSLVEILEGSQKMISRVSFLSVLESTRYLLRMGGNPGDSGKASENSNSNPIMGIVNGTGLMERFGAGTSRKNAQRKAIDMIRQFADAERPLHVMLHYCQEKAEVKELENLISKRNHSAEVCFSQFSPVVISSVGPAVAVSFYS